MFEFEYTFPLPHNLRRGEWSGFEMERRDATRMESSNAYTWGGFIAQSIYVDIKQDDVYWFATKVQKKYILGEKNDCIVIYSPTYVGEGQGRLVSWYVGTAPCSYCRSYSEMMKKEFALDPPARRRVLRPLTLCVCGCLDITMNLPFSFAS